MPTVYLAGPISGEDWITVTQWRLEAAADLLYHGINTSDPLRGKQYLAAHQTMPKDVPDKPMSTNQAIVIRDKYDVQNADLIIFNFLDTKRVSIGSVWEVGVAEATGVPYIVVIKPDDLHNHPMITTRAYAVVDSIETAIGLALQFLKPYI